MNSITLHTENEAELSAVAGKLDELIRTSAIKTVLLEGDLGAGKTALVRAYMQLKNGSEEVSSPSFSLLNEYRSGEDTIYHFDLYRLENREEIVDIGFFEYLYSGALNFIEWPDKITDLLPEGSYIRVRISLPLNSCRDFSISW